MKSISLESAQTSTDLEAYYAHVFGLDHSELPPHANYSYGDGTYAHAFLCTDLMKPRSYYPPNPNTLSRCRITINPDGSLNLD